MLTKCDHHCVWREGGHSSSQDEGFVYDRVSNEGNNQLYMVERTSCYGPQLHI